jgi:uncharacterized RDD family membrane protein YckC
MKCPKCDYLGFETGDRCKNCGYDFSLLGSPRSDPADLTLKPSVRDDVPVGDLWLESAGPGASSAEGRGPIESFPLFSPTGDDEPLIKTPSEPRAPLSVRRAPERARGRGASRMEREIDTVLALQFAEEAAEPIAPPSIEPAVAIAPTPFRIEAPGPSSIAGLGLRTLAACIDHAILFGIDVVVFYSTLRMTALEADEWRALPLLPLLAFLLLLKLSYFAAFTAMGGQTIGKMATGIRVVADDQFMMDPARAITRTLTGAISLGSLGLGLIPALIDPDRRAFHDRVAHTHVVDLPSA